MAQAGSGLSPRGISSRSITDWRVCGTFEGTTGDPDMVDGDAGELRVGDGLLYIVPVSLVFCLDVKSIAGVGSAWNAVSVLDSSSSYNVISIESIINSTYHAPCP